MSRAPVWNSRHGWLASAAVVTIALEEMPAAVKKSIGCIVYNVIGALRANVTLEVTDLEVMIGKRLISPDAVHV